jgi:hypothetical protein
MLVVPGASFEAVLEAGTPGQAGVYRLRILDNIGGVTEPASAVDVTEIASGVYCAVRVSPAAAGQYTLVWDDGSDDGVLGVEDLTVAYGLAAGVVVSPLYLTRDELKASRGIDGSFEDADIDRNLLAACRGIDDACHRHFYTIAETRYFALSPWGSADIDDLVSASEVAVDLSDDRSYATGWLAGTDYDLESEGRVVPKPGRPYDALIVRRGRSFPTTRRGLKITGVWGWPSVPAGVVAYTAILTNRLLNRKKSPLGFVIASGLDAGAVARVARTDPDFQLLCGDLIRSFQLA